MRSGPELSRTEWVLILVAAPAFCLWGLPAITAQIKLHMPPRPVHALALNQTAPGELERRYAMVLAACFNGEAITDGAVVVECRRVEP